MRRPVMSSIPEWTYVNVAKVKPFVRIDLLSGVTEYGDEYEILCDFEIVSEQTRANDGAEFISRHKIYTEDKRPKYLDMILLPMAAGWEEVRFHQGWPMGAFDEPDRPDFLMVT